MADLDLSILTKKPSPASQVSSGDTNVSSSVLSTSNPSLLTSKSRVSNSERPRYPKEYTFSWKLLLLNFIVSFSLRVFSLDVLPFPLKRLLADVSSLPNTTFLGNTAAAEAGFRLLIHELAACKYLSGYGRLAYAKYVTFALEGRRDFIRYINEHPQVSKVDIGNPIIITGLHRTCSTLLHRLLALDPACRTTTALDTQYISGFPLMPPIRSEEERSKHPRALQWKDQYLKTWKQHAPEEYGMLMRNHRFDPLEAEEEIFLYQQHGSFIMKSVLLDQIAHGTASGENLSTPKNSYTEWCLDEKCQEDAILLIKRYIQAFHEAWAPTSHWCLKAPQHALFPEAVYHHFPEARYIIAHRDPLEAVPSAARMVAEVLTAYVQSETLDLHGVGRSMLRQSSLKLERLNAFRQRIRASDPERERSQFLDVKSDEVINCPVSTLRRIYSHFGLKFSLEHELAVVKWLEQDKLHRKEDLHGGAGKPLRPPLQMQDFGLTVEQIVKEFPPDEFDELPI